MTGGCRVGIIDHGRLVAEGTPDELKRSIGTDLVVAVVEGDPDIARRALAPLQVVEHVDVNGLEVTAAVTNGPAAVSPVALALAEAGGGLLVRELSLRTPTLDDVFLSVTGARIADRDGDTDPARTVEEAR